MRGSQSSYLWLNQLIIEVIAWEFYFKINKNKSHANRNVQQT